jgi:hypothetical protein
MDTQGRKEIAMYLTEEKARKKWCPQIRLSLHPMSFREEDSLLRALEGAKKESDVIKIKKAEEDYEKFTSVYRSNYGDISINRLFSGEIPPNAYCIASECMMWTWEIKCTHSPVSTIDTPKYEETGKGGCGLAKQRGLI